jgi:cytoskeletal protein RodZ
MNLENSDYPIFTGSLFYVVSIWTFKLNWTNFFLRFTSGVLTESPNACVTCAVWLMSSFVIHRELWL